MNNNRYIILFFVIAIILICILVGFGVYINATSSEHIEKLTNAQYAKVRTVKVSYQNITPTVQIPSIHLTSAWMSDIHVKLDGTLSALYIKQGEKIKKGQLIGEIANDELPSQILQIEGIISKANTVYTMWQNTTKRYQSLYQAGGISLQQMDEAVANRNAAAAEVASAEAQREQLISRMKNQKIIAPQDGDILKIYHTPGAFLSLGSSVVMIGDFSALFIKMNLPSTQLEQLLSVSDNFKLSIPVRQSTEKAYAANFESASSISDFDLILTTVSPPLKEPSQYRSVVWQIDNHGAVLEPGTYYQAEIYLDTPKSTLAIPKEALLDKIDSFVYIVNEGRLEQRQIKTGVQGGEFIEILDGLKENDVVVISGKVGLNVGDRVHSLD